MRVASRAKRLEAFQRGREGEEEGRIGGRPGEIWEGRDKGRKKVATWLTFTLREGVYSKVSFPLLEL